MSSSIANATATRVDSAAKHTLPCKVSDTVLKVLARDSKSIDRIHLDKMIYCMHKDELVLCCAKPMKEEESSIYKTMRQVYPPVISTLGVITEDTKEAILKVYRAKTLYEYEREKATGDLADFPEFSFQGVAMTQAWATPNFGDTVGTVLVGGMMTIVNGAFPIYTGDLVQWYFDFEEGEFDEAGTRVTEPKGVKLDESALSRRKFNDRNNNFRIPGYKGQFKQNIIFPKPMISRHYGDVIRVFGRCVNGGRPFEGIDVLIGSQCS